MTRSDAKGYNPRLMNSYAIIQTGGKQYRVAEGDTLKVQKLDGNAGDEIKIDDQELKLVKFEDVMAIVE